MAERLRPFFKKGEGLMRTITMFLLGELIFILAVAQIVTLFFTAYQTFISFVGMIKREKRNTEGSIGRKFALLVCAHNEEQVVGEIVDNLMSLDYPKELYDVFVIADNCNDSTAKIARERGALAFERYNKEKVGKGYGIEWALDNLWQLEEQGNIYDAIAIFDADNLTTNNFLKQVNEKMESGHEVIQTYLDSKNPNDTWITRSYAFSYWATSQIYQLARENIGLSAQLGGTGLVVSTKVLKEMGWGATSLTEDLEFTARYIIEHDKRVAWVHEAKIFDEKPLKLKQSYVQRMRWMKGHFDCAERYFMPLIKKILTGKSKLLYIDMLIYLIQPSKIVLAMAGLGFFFLSLFRPMPDFIMNYVLNAWVWWMVLGIYYLQPFVGLIFERKGSKSWWFIQTYLFSLSWVPIVAVAWFKRKEKTWNHTQHTRAIKADEIKELSV